MATPRQLPNVGRGRPGAGGAALNGPAASLDARVGVAVFDEPRFDALGYVGPTRIFSPRECRAILQRLERPSGGPLRDWQKSWGAVSPEYFGIAADDRILDLVGSLIGEDVMLWGASIVTRRPNQVHPWHTDIESSLPDGRTVTVWIGLENTNALSSLTVVPRSHRFGATIQQVVQERGRAGSVTDDDVAEWARERDGRSGVVSLDTSDGEAIVFDGRLWHASHNRNQAETRRALLLQYATPDTAIRIPNYNRLRWPFEQYDMPRPPCVLVSGRAMETTNRIVPAPPAAPVGAVSLSSRIHPLRLPLEQDPEKGFKPHPLFRGATPGLKLLGCHVSILDPGRQPHDPHRHAEEELLIVLDGRADLIWQDGPDVARTVTHRADAGAFAYYPAQFLHTIRNSSDRPVTYLMFKWIGDRSPAGEFERARLVPPSGVAPSSGDTGKPLRHERVLDGDTEYLRHLHAHRTEIAPRGGYAAHVDAYDVGIVLFEGTVETLGQRVEAPAAIFYAAGEPHGMTNVGETPARYLVFEFHGRHRDTSAPYDPSFARRLVAVLRDPQRLREAVKRRLGL